MKNVTGIKIFTFKCVDVSIQLGIFVLCNTTTQWQVTVCIRHAIYVLKHYNTKM